MSAASCDACGWLAAFCSMLAFGSFGVPIKSKTALEVDIDPLVMQSYKTAMCFLTSWLVLLDPSVPFEFSAWGIVSGLFWVPGGIATVYAIKAAGIAMGIGIGSSFIVLVSFVWGIFIFEEHVHSRVGACFAIFCMMLGLTGMSYFSSPTTIHNNTADNVTSGTPVPLSPDDDDDQDHRHHLRFDENETTSAASVMVVQSARSSTDDVVSKLSERTAMTATTTRSNSYSNLESFEQQQQQLEQNANREGSDTGDFPHPDVDDGEDDDDDLAALETYDSFQAQENYLYFTRRQRGMIAAMFTGVYGGSIMAPMKYAPAGDKGVHYLMSFSIGASLVTLLLWMVRFLYYAIRHQSFLTAYFKLPSFYIRVMWKPGGLCGLLWSIGNFFSLISVYYLGEGVGYPLVQTSILVSGLWGIFYFKEVEGWDLILKWLASSLLTIFGILLLSYEHFEK